MLVMSVVSLEMSFARFPFLFEMGSSKVELSALYFFVFIWINFLVNWLKQELAAISGIFSLVLLHTQMILCYWLLQLSLCDLSLVSVIIMR